MKLKGIKKTVSVLKNSSFARIYVNTQTGNVFAVQYTDCNSYTQFDSPNIEHVCRFNCRFDNPTMKWVESEVSQRLYELGFEK